MKRLVRGSSTSRWIQTPLPTAPVGSITKRPWTETGLGHEAFGWKSGLNSKKISCSSVILRFKHSSQRLCQLMAVVSSSSGVVCAQGSLQGHRRRGESSTGKRRAALEYPHGLKSQQPLTLVWIWQLWGAHTHTEMHSGSELMLLCWPHVGRMRSTSPHCWQQWPFLDWAMTRAVSSHHRPLLPIMVEEGQQGQEAAQHHEPAGALQCHQLGDTLRAQCEPSLAPMTWTIRVSLCHRCCQMPAVGVTVLSVNATLSYYTYEKWGCASMTQTAPSRNKTHTYPWRNVSPPTSCLGTGNIEPTM